MSIPHLTTERLLLRGFVPEDFEPYADMMAREETVELSGAPSVLYRYPST